MKKTFVTIMPDHMGAFLKASELFSSLGVNITRVSYNKAVDSHMLFIDCEGDEDKIVEASKMLSDIGYLQSDESEKTVLLVEFKLKDEPGTVTGVLRIISDYNFNISYISSAQNGSDYQYFKMGIVVGENDDIDKFIEDVSKLCEARIINYNHADRIFDNSLFYFNFVNELTSLMDIGEDQTEELLVNTNLAMQKLDELGVSPYHTFESISRFCELLSESRGDNFKARITEHRITDNTTITLIEPPCGSNTAIIKSFDKYLFVDTGYAYCKDEMLKLFRNIIPDFDNISKDVFITHADVDHLGLVDIFDNVYLSYISAKCITLEYEGNEGFREMNPIHKPYIRICKILTSYKVCDPEKLRVVGDEVEGDEILQRTGHFDFGDLHFELYQGKGGHLRGESVLIDYDNHLVFSGDVFVNLKDMTEAQSKYNQYAPILMTSVDTDPKLCSEERKAMFARLGIGSWQIFGGHGAMMEYNLVREK